MSDATSPALSNSELCPFVSPELPAPGAPVVWQPYGVVAALTAKAGPSEFAEDRDFALDQLSVRAHVHFDAAERQIVVLESDTYQITLIVEGLLVTLGSVQLLFSSAGIHRLERHIATLQVLTHVLHKSKLAGPLMRPGPIDAVHYRNAIIAIDGELAGASRREIAAVIYGAEVAQEWSNSDRLKAMVKRDVRRGRRLLAGGWRELVAGGAVRPLT